MLEALAQLLPLGRFPAETLNRGVTLHHFGLLDVFRHELDRPLWVSDDVVCAEQYKHFGVAAPRYTQLITTLPFQILNLNGTRLQPIAAELKIHHHPDWNALLARYLIARGVQGFVYAGREIFLAEPCRVIEFISSYTYWGTDPRSESSRIASPW